MSSSSARCTRARRLRDVGDLKAGGDGACTDSLYTTALANFNTLKRPLVWLPGDNDWTDCWGCYGPGTGGFDLWNAWPASELFAATDQSLGAKTLTNSDTSASPRPWRSEQR